MGMLVPLDIEDTPYISYQISSINLDTGMAANFNGLQYCT
jgi:hypothetical protein